MPSSSAGRSSFFLALGKGLSELGQAGESRQRANRNVSVGVVGGHNRKVSKSVLECVARCCRSGHAQGLSYGLLDPFATE